MGGRGDRHKKIEMKSHYFSSVDPRNLLDACLSYNTRHTVAHKITLI